MAENRKNPQDQSIVEQNIQDLLSKAYQPEEPGSEFASAVEAMAVAAAKAQAEQAAASAGGAAEPSPRLKVHAGKGGKAGRAGLGVRRLFSPLTAAAAAVTVVGVFVAWHFLTQAGRVDTNTATNNGRGGAVAPSPSPSVWDSRVGSFLTPQARKATAAPEEVKPGGTIKTAAGQRRRVALDDGSILYVNQKSELRVDGPREVTLAAGEAFIEVSPRQAADAGATFVVHTAGRTVTALGTKFAVRVADKTTSVVVAQGKVSVSSAKGDSSGASLVQAGRQLLADGGTDRVAPAPRVTEELQWTRDLMAEADTPLVPASEYSGGALVAVDPNGQEVKLSLRKYHVDVHIEDGFARTTIDQTYFNHEQSRMEGTFYFPLPPDASLSRLAMYVDGKLMEGGMAERDYARQVFESIMYQRRDPALLEWLDGSTFKMRVFPLEGRQEKRIILSYTQRLDTADGRTVYRFPAGHNLAVVRDWSFHARLVGAAAGNWASDSHAFNAVADGRDLILDSVAKDIKIDQDVTLNFQASPEAAGAGVRFSSAYHEGSKYLMLRWRPDLPPAEQRQRRDWVFIFESSGDRSPLLARAQIDIIRAILDNAERDDRFAILSAGTRVTAFGDELLPVTADNVKSAVEFIEKAHLVGALDLEQAIAAAGALAAKAQNAHIVHVGGGVAVLGQRRDDLLAAGIPDGARYVGIGVGKQWARSFMRTAASKTGGYFTQINPDENIAWRAFETVGVLNSPRLLNASVADASGNGPAFLCFDDSLWAGRELCAVTRVDGGRELPTAVTVTGMLDGKPFTQTLTVGQVDGKAGYLPRMWAKLEIDRLVAENAEANKGKIVELSKAMYVMSPFTSLLVLENEAMYKQYNVDRGRQDHWAMYPAPETTPVVNEPLQGKPSTPTATGQPDARKSSQQVLESVLVRVPPAMLYWPNIGNTYSGQMLSVWQVYTGAYALPVTWDYGDRNGDWGEGLRAPRLTLWNGQRPYTVYGVRDLIHGVPNFNGPVLDVSGRLAPIDGQAVLGIGQPSVAKQLAEMKEAMPLDKASRSGQWFRTLRGGGSGWWMTPPVTLSMPVPTSRRPISGPVSVSAIPGGGLAIPTPSAARFSSSLRLDTGFSSYVGQPIRVSGLDAWTDGTAIWRTPSHATGVLVLGDIPVMNGAITLTTDQWAQSRLQVGSGSYIDLSNFTNPGNWTYQRPSFTSDWRIFSDLLAFAPGMNTSEADVYAVLEAESGDMPAAVTGRIDPAARKLIESARNFGWRELTVPGKDGKPALVVVFDGAARYTMTRTIDGLAERTLCDGRTLCHLYADLGVGAKRTYSRFHEAQFRSLVPYIVPAVEDLARGADVVSVDEHTVAIIPIPPKPAADAPATQPANVVQLHLVFADSGALAERRLVEAPAADAAKPAAFWTGKVLCRQVIDADGTITLMDGEGKTVDTVKWGLKPASAPDMGIDSELVVVPMPIRSLQKVWELADRPGKERYTAWSEDEALSAMMANLYSDPSTAMQIMGQRFLAKGDRRLGLYTLLLAGNRGWNPGEAVQVAGPQLKFKFDPAADHPGSELARYISSIASRMNTGSHTAVGYYDKAGGLIDRLAEFHDLFLRWNNGQATSGDDARRQSEKKLALDFIRRNKGTAIGLSALLVVQNYLGSDPGLADAWKAMGDGGLVCYWARYETARAAQQAGKYKEASEQFADLYRSTLEAGVLPPFDNSMYSAIVNYSPTTLAADSGAARWSALIRETAGKLVEKKARPLAMVLALQCWNVGDQAMAEEVFNQSQAIGASALSEDERLCVSLAGVQYLWQTGQYPRADAMLQPLLEDKAFNGDPWLWRLGAALASQRGRLAQSLRCSEQAMDIEYRNLPELVNLQAVRNDYGGLLASYQQLAAAVATLDQTPPRDLIAKIVRAADRWRSLDSDPTSACQAAATALQNLGVPDLAWEYLTTPLAGKPNESAPWLGLAQQLRQQGELDLSARAYASAFAAEGSNAQILWDWAQVLRQSGKADEALKLCRQIADGRWQPRFSWLQTQAKRYVQTAP